jgi:DNA-binding CsgD family transcriptional regulator
VTGTDSPPPLVGRERELAALVEVVRRVRQGGRLAELTGEAGIGKTRLVMAALEAAAAGGALVLSSRADELDRHRPFAPILELCSDADDPALRRRIVEAMSLGETGPGVEGERQFRVAETVLDALEERSVRAPVTVAFEDLQWADPGTLGVIAQVAKGIDSLPVVLIVSARPEPRRAELDRLVALFQSLGAPRIQLGPLDSRACAELVEALVGAPAGPRLLGQTSGASGNPLFVTELIGTLMADGVIRHKDGIAEVAAAHAPPSLPITILHRLSFLPLEELELLGLASVLGTSFSAEDLALLAERPVVQLVPALQSARRAGVLGEQGERLAFRHDLIRDALYQDLPVSVRRALHGAFARALDAAGQPPERMTEHLLRAAAPGDERSLNSLVSAARGLTSRGPTAAVDLYRRAIDLAADPAAARLELLPELAEALVSAGVLGEAEEACREAISRGLDPQVASHLRLQLVMLLTRRPRTAAALREAEAGLAAADTPAQSRMRLRSWMALTRVFEGDLDGAVRDAKAVLPADEDLLSRSLALDALALVASARGRFAEAAALIGESAREVEAIGTREAYDSCPHMILGLQLARLDELDQAYDAIQRGRRASESLGMVDTLASFHYQLALVDLVRGHIDDALAELATHHQYAEQTGAGWSVPADSVHSLIALHRGDLLAAERHVSAAEQAAAAGAPQHAIDLMVLARARLLEATGNRPAALDTLSRAFEMADAAGAAAYHPVVAPELARLAALAGQPDRAAATVPALERICELNPGIRSLKAAALHARGWLEGDRAALESAACLIRDSGRPLEAARIAEDAAASTREEPERARELLDGARAAYERSGATYDLARVDAALRALGSRRGVRGRRQRPRTGWEALTDTELSVVRLVAERLTNPEIAERLFISRRTVQTHVSHALAKLGVSSRRELAAEAARRVGWRIRLEDGGEQAEQTQPSVESAGGASFDDDDP